MAELVKPYTFSEDTDAVAGEVNANFDALYDWVNTQAMDASGSKAFDAIPSGPAANPTTDNQFTRKKYVDDRCDAVQTAARDYVKGCFQSWSNTKTLNNTAVGTFTANMPKVTSNWVVVGQVMATGSSSRLGLTVLSHNAGVVQFQVWTRSGEPVTATVEVELIAINGNQLGTLAG